MLYLKPLYNNLKTLDRFNELFSFLKTSEIAFVINCGFNFHKASNIFIEFAWLNKYNGNTYNKYRSGKFRVDQKYIK